MPLPAALIIDLVREVGPIAARGIAAIFRKHGEEDLAQKTEAALANSDADLDAVLEASKREQNR